MPLPVQPWAGNTFPTAKSLDLACYTCDGTLDSPNGIAFHARRPMTAEVYGTPLVIPSGPSGLRTVLDESAAGQWNATLVVDNAGYYGQVSDGSYPFCGYHLIPAVTGSAGDGVTPGGVVLMGHFLPLSGNPTQQAVAADFVNSGSLTASGARQVPCVGHDSIPFCLDLQDATGGTWQPAAWITDSASAAASLSVNPADSSGETPRFFTLWAGVSAAQQDAYGTPASPAPHSSFTAATTIGATLAGGADVNLNGPDGIAGPLNFLSSPPLMRASRMSGMSVPSGTPKAVGLNMIPDLDSYGGWGSPGGGTGASYTVQRDGLHLGHAVVPYNAQPGGSRQAGISVNGTVYWGPPYRGTGADRTICTKTQVFDLKAGDVVQAWTRQSSGTPVTLSSFDESRLFLTWLGALGFPAGPWVPPDPGFSWQAGTPVSSLPPLFQQHVASDLGFLVNRPYFLGYQSFAQSGFGNGSLASLVPDTTAGIIHGTPGDNYGGGREIISGGKVTWSYFAQQPGWYLAVMEAFTTFPTTTATPALTAAFSVPASGGRQPGQPFDRYQQILPPLNGWNPGVTAVGLYYLLEGEFITPQVLAQDWTSTSWGTVPSAGMNTHLELAWVSE